MGGCSGRGWGSSLRLVSRSLSAAELLRPQPGQLFLCQGALQGEEKESKKPSPVASATLMLGSNAQSERLPSSSHSLKASLTESKAAFFPQLIIKIWSLAWTSG